MFCEALSRLFPTVLICGCLVLSYNVVSTESSNATTIPTNISFNNKDHPILANLSDAFSGLILNYNRDPGGPNEFHPEEIALAAITAMKEEAVENFSAIVDNFDFVDWEHVDDRVGISMQAGPRAPRRLIRRSSVMWALKTLAVELLRTRFLRPSKFIVNYLTSRLYNGVLYNRQSTGSVTESISKARTHSSPPELLVIRTPNDSTSAVVDVSPALSEDPHFKLYLQFLGQSLPQISMFESILTFLLAFGELGPSSVQETAGMEERELQAWIYMVEVSPPPRTYRFQQYQAVAILEGMARYQVAHTRYEEMTFEFMAEGLPLARGCLVKALESRRWCRHMFPGEVLEPSSRLDQTNQTQIA
ncbi:MAG: hypothetical protein Q9220_003334 [cf. Caloplaca sp. 1 TL-2023]